MSEKNIVIVHQDSEILSVLIEKLDKDLALKAIGLKNPEEAINFIKNKEVSLVITDFSFGLANASAIYALIKKKKSQIPTLLISSLGISGIMNDPEFAHFLDDNKLNRYLEINEAKTEISAIVAEILQIKTDVDLSSKIEIKEGEDKRATPKATSFNFNTKKSETWGESFGSILFIHNESSIKDELAIILRSLFKIEIFFAENFSKASAMLNSLQESSCKGILAPASLGKESVAKLLSEIQTLKLETPVAFYGNSFPDEHIDFEYFLSQGGNFCFLAFPLTPPKCIKCFESHLGIDLLPGEKIENEALHQVIYLVPLYPDDLFSLVQTLPDSVVYEKKDHNLIKIEKKDLKGKVEAKNKAKELLFIEKKIFDAILIKKFEQLFPFHQGVPFE